MDGRWMMLSDGGASAMPYLASSGGITGASGTSGLIIGIIIVISCEQFDYNSIND